MPAVKCHAVSLSSFLECLISGFSHVSLNVLRNQSEETSNDINNPSVTAEISILIFEVGTLYRNLRDPLPRPKIYLAEKLSKFLIAGRESKFRSYKRLFSAKFFQGFSSFVAFICIC